MKYLILILVANIFLACSNHQPENLLIINDFPNEKTLIGEIILEDEIKGFSVQLIDTVLMIQLTEDERVWSVYNTRNLKHLGYLGRIGDTPNAFISPKFSYQYNSESNDYKLWLYDSRKYQLRKVSLYESLNKDKLVIEKEINIKPKSTLDQIVFHITDSLIIGNQGYLAIDKSRLKGYNPISERFIYDSGLEPSMRNGEQLFGPELYNIYFDYLAITPSGEFISAMTRFDRIDMFTKNLKLYKTITNGNFIDKFDAKFIISEKAEKEENFFYYMGIYPGKNKFYALYRNQRVSQYYKASNQTEIHVFDYNGNPLQKLIIPDYLISFTVDETNGYLYGVDRLNEKILNYKL